LYGLINWKQLIYRKFNNQIPRNSTMTFKEALEKIGKHHLEDFERFKEAWNKLRVTYLYWDCKQIAQSEDDTKVPEISIEVFLFLKTLIFSHLCVYVWHL